MSTESRLFAGDDTVTERIVEARRARRFYLLMIAVLGLLALASLVLWSRGQAHPLLIAFVALSCAAGASAALLLARGSPASGAAQPGSGTASRQPTQPRPRS